MNREGKGIRILPPDAKSSGDGLDTLPVRSEQFAPSALCALIAESRSVPGTRRRGGEAAQPARSPQGSSTNRSTKSRHPPEAKPALIVRVNPQRTDGHGRQVPGARGRKRGGHRARSPPRDRVAAPGLQEEVPQVRPRVRVPWASAARAPQGAGQKRESAAFARTCRKRWSGGRG